MAVKASLSCSWCHEMNDISPNITHGVAIYCRNCGHRADVARVDCDCRNCKATRRLIETANAEKGNEQ